MVSIVPPSSSSICCFSSNALEIRWFLMSICNTSLLLYAVGFCDVQVHSVARYVTQGHGRVLETIGWGIQKNNEGVRDCDCIGLRVCLQITSRFLATVRNNRITDVPGRSFGIERHEGTAPGRYHQYWKQLATWC